MTGDLVIVAGLLVIVAALAAAAIAAPTARTEARRQVERANVLPPSEGMVLSGRAGREALGATLRQLEGDPDAPVLCEMSGRRVNHVGLISCPARGCTRYADVDPDGVVEPHWTRPALPLPAMDDGGPF